MCGIFFLNIRFGFGSILKKKLWFGSEWVWFALVWKMQFGSDSIVIYYFVIVNLQQILQHYCYDEWTVLLCVSSLSAHWVQVKLFFVTFNLNCRLRAVSVGKPSERMSNFWTSSDFWKPNPNQFSVFRTSLQ